MGAAWVACVRACVHALCCQRTHLQQGGLAAAGRAQGKTQQVKTQREVPGIFEARGLTADPFSEPNRHRLAAQARQPWMLQALLHRWPPCGVRLQHPRQQVQCLPRNWRTPCLDDLRYAVGVQPLEVGVAERGLPEGRGSRRQDEQAHPASKHVDRRDCVAAGLGRAGLVRQHRRRKEDLRQKLLPPAVAARKAHFARTRPRRRQHVHGSLLRDVALRGAVVRLPHGAEVPEQAPG
mmetsp:Transcript_65488/g.206946  ORF Transcript_65488/g.206946 Transcript_65488/m.206946 type:complete len:236 (-) Transcript_65488:772-1479(-)